MSEENERTVPERVGVRWPSMAPQTMAWVLRLRRGSRVRKVMLERFARTVFLSWNRGDYALVPIIDDPEVEVRFTVRDRPAVGTDDVYYGADGHCRAMEEWNEAWREWDARIDEVIEEGRDQVLTQSADGPFYLVVESFQALSKRPVGRLDVVDVHSVPLG